MVRLQFWRLGNMKYNFITITPSSTLMLYSHIIHIQLYTYTDACRDIFNPIKTSGHSSLEKYTSHFIERVVCERWVGDWTELQHIDPPQLFWLSQPFFPVLLDCSSGGLGAQPLLGYGSHSSIFSPTDLNFLSLGLYNNFTSAYFLRASQFALNSTLRQLRLSSDIFDRMHLLFTQVHFLFWQLGRGQYVTLTRRSSICVGFIYESNRTVQSVTMDSYHY